jgi:hypothetical protein
MKKLEITDEMCEAFWDGFGEVKKSYERTRQGLTDALEGYELAAAPAPPGDVLTVDERPAPVQKSARELASIVVYPADTLEEMARRVEALDELVPRAEKGDGK